MAHTPQAKFVWIGSFEPEGDFAEAAIEAEVRRLGLEQNVTFTGEMEDPTSLIAKASAFLLTSRDDPKPKVLMEALALGKHCIAFDVGGVRELLGAFGTVVPPNDVAAFCQALQAHQQAPPLSEAAQKQQREWYLQHYSPEAFSHRFVQAVEWWSRR
ncbi:MAG: glycosyltransferase [Elainellaceae cyanobacterium]